MLEKKEIFQMYFENIYSERFESEDKGCYFYQYKKFTLKIIVSNDFPHSLPEFYLSNYMAFNKWYSHVGSEGKLCYISEDNLIWDFNNPCRLLKDCCEKVKELLDSWDTPKMIEDLRQEFLSYWQISCLNSKTKYISIQSYLSRVGSFEKHELVLSNQNCYLFNYGSQLKESVAPHSKKSSDVYILPLKDSTSVIPPNPLDELTEATFKKMITGNLSSGVRRRFQKWCKTKRKSFILIVSLPISDNDYVLFGASFESRTSKYPFKIDNKVPQKNKDRKKLVLRRRNQKMGISRLLQYILQDSTRSIE